MTETNDEYTIEVDYRTADPEWNDCEEDYVNIELSMPARHFQEAFEGAFKAPLESEWQTKYDELIKTLRRTVGKASYATNMSAKEETLLTAIEDVFKDYGQLRILMQNITGESSLCERGALTDQMREWIKDSTAR